jgi:hypothetical protein
MKHVLKRRKSVVGIVVVSIGMIAGGVAYASVPDSAGVIHGCYAKKNGTLRVIDTAVKSQKCGTNELALNWNQTGAKGATGPKGAAGPAGPMGPQGAIGPQGPAGASAGFSRSLAGPINIPDAAAPLVTLSLPSGKYLLQAKVAVSNLSAATAGTVDCSLVAGSDSDGVPLDLDSASAGVPSPTRPLSFELAHTFDSTGNAVLQCGDSGGGFIARQASIQATQVSQLDSAAISSPPIAPDLVPTNIVSTGQDEVQVTIQNQGNAEAGPFTVSLQNDGASGGVRPFSGLHAGSSVSLTQGCVGTYTWTTHVAQDPSVIVPELDTTNSTLVKKLAC